MMLHHDEQKLSALLGKPLNLWEGKPPECLLEKQRQADVKVAK